MKVKTRKLALKQLLVQINLQISISSQQVDLTLLRSLNMRRNTASGTSGQVTGNEEVELVDDLEKLERGREREERRGRRSVGSETSGQFPGGDQRQFSGGDQRQFSRGETKPFSGSEPRPAPQHTLALLVTLADLPLSDNCLASLLCRVADHPLLGAVPQPHTLEDGERGRHCGRSKCGMFLF